MTAALNLFMNISRGSDNSGGRTPALWPYTALHVNLLHDPKIGKSAVRILPETRNDIMQCEWAYTSDCSSHAEQD